MPGIPYFPGNFITGQPHFMNTKYIAVIFSSTHTEKENQISNQINIPKQKGYCPDFSDHCTQVT